MIESIEEAESLEEAHSVAEVEIRARLGVTCIIIELESVHEI